METEEKRRQIPNSIGRAVFVALSFLLQVGWILGFALYLTRYYAVIQLASSLLALLLVFSVYGRNMNSAFRLSWIILILLFPVLGTCLYLLFGRPVALWPLRRRLRAADAALEPARQRERENGAAVTRDLRAAAPDLGGQVTYLQDRAGYPVYHNTRVRFYGDDIAAVVAEDEVAAAQALRAHA